MQTTLNKQYFKPIMRQDHDNTSQLQAGINSSFVLPVRTNIQG